MNCSRPAPALHVLQKETQIFQPTSIEGMHLSKPMVAASCDQRPWELKFMQPLGNLLPSAQSLCEATLSFGLFTSRLRLSMQIFGSRRWCRRICSPCRQSSRSCWNSCPTRSTFEPGSAKFSTTIGLFGSVTPAIGVTSTLAIWPMGAAGRFSDLAEGVQVLEFYRYLLHLSRLAHCV
jgi:hypothetical protein